MNNIEITPEQAKAARDSLGLSQRFIATETGINRSQLALFEVGKYNLEAFKRLALADFYARLGYRFAELPSPLVSSPSIQKAGVAAIQKLKRASVNEAVQLPRIIDGIVISVEIVKSDIDRITAEIKSNDFLIERLAITSVDLALFSGEPRTHEHETLIRLMARNYQLMRSLQGWAVLPEESRNSAKNNSARQKSAGELACALLISEIEQLENKLSPDKPLLNHR
ncbi:MAG: helix-turn-helix transcriptional regulator [Gallionellaceae bacterium]